MVSSRQWYFRFHEVITSIGMSIIEEDHCVYAKTEENFVPLSIVDNILLARNDMELVNATKD